MRNWNILMHTGRDTEILDRTGKNSQAEICIYGLCGHPE